MRAVASLLLLLLCPCLVGVVLSAGRTFAALPPEPSLVPNNATRLAVIGDGAPLGLGIFDPCIAAADGDDAGSGSSIPVAVMSYSSVSPDQISVHTKLAYSNDSGNDWYYGTDVNAATPLTIDCNPLDGPNGTCSGMLVHEVSTVIIDPSDPDPDRKVKVFTHSYLVQIPGMTLRYMYGFISMFTAPSISTPTSEWQHTPLLGWISDSSFSSTGVQQIITTSIPELHDCWCLTEPSAMLRPDIGNGVIDLAVGCAYTAPGLSERIRIVLLRSYAHTVDGFQYINTLVDGGDGPLLGFTGPQSNAANLFMAAGGRYFVSFTPLNQTNEPNHMMGYVGCLVVEIIDSINGVVARDPQPPHALTTQYIDMSNGYFCGACTIRPDLMGLPQFLMDVLWLDGRTSDPFQIVITPFTI